MQVSSNADQGKDESLEACAGSSDRTESAAGDAAEAEVGDRGESGDGGDEEAPRDAARHLVKLSYHDSGIDIRDPLLHVTPVNSKKVSCKY